MNMTVTTQPTHESAGEHEPGVVMRFDVVRGLAAANIWVLSAGQRASRAVGCLVEPEQGDRVLVASEGSEQVILSVISRQEGALVSLNTANGGDVQLTSGSISLHAERGVELQAHASILLAAPFGDVEFVAANLTQSVQGCAVTLADTIVDKARNVHLTADESIITRTQVHSVTADQDLFMDADRINMG